MKIKCLSGAYVCAKWTLSAGGTFGAKITFFCSYWDEVHRQLTVNLIWSQGFDFNAIFSFRELCSCLQATSHAKQPMHNSVFTTSPICFAMPQPSTLSTLHKKERLPVAAVIGSRSSSLVIKFVKSSRPAYGWPYP